MRLAYRVVHNARLGYWRVRRPSTHGSLLLVRHEGKLLVLRTTYRDALALPGGYVNPDETPRAAALRELREELGLTIPPDALAHLGRHTFEYEHRADACDLFLVDVPNRPHFEVNGYEVAWAGWLSPEEIARAPHVVPHLRAFAEGHLGQA